MKKVLFIDRDGCIVAEPADEQVDSFEKLRFLPGAITALAKLRRETDYLFVMVTNQDGLGTASHPEENFWPVHNFILQTLKDEGVEFDEIHIDPHRPEDNHPNRKPGTGMLTHFMKGEYDLANSYVIGDRPSDVELAKNLECKAIRIGDKIDGAELCTEAWSDIYKHLTGLGRTATVRRKTSETDIAVSINLDGSGISKINTGLGFYDHMLEQLSKHGGIDLDISVKGDLHIDEHHTIEDTALALGQAFREALGSKKGMARYGFLLPMDDALAQVAIDFGGRPWLEWDAEFKREKIGEMPTEMFMHFFKSFSDEARCNLNIKAEGENEHHKIEAIFKGWARAIRMAVAKTGGGEIPSTKGTL
ncbi:MAG: bifunctional histidinol-phosphatase/imidazoleglycerol-phosphate dehydratase HisB [Flavobacteriales bacterium]|nr:bifunctional histidinol-phosphatase/imidazoleglycerol-phosphate dehydratase HisB [Flavobacteriales bacterium]